MSEMAAKRILIVEDEVLVAMHIEDLLLAMGHEIVGPAFRFKDAIILAASGDIDFAILDVNLAGTPSFPIADILLTRGIPFVFATGYGNEGVAPRYGTASALRKPYSRSDLERAVDGGLNRASVVADQLR